MRKLIAGINMSLDGYCDHTLGVPDEALHLHYSETLDRAGTLLYGRTTYQLMESYWPELIKHPSGNKGLDDFAQSINRLPKLVFSRTLHELNWHSARLATRDLETEVRALKQEDGKDMLVGSPGLIAQLTALRLIDEYQLCIHPVIAGSGLTLFKNIGAQCKLKLIGTKTFEAGPVILIYQND